MKWSDLLTPPYTQPEQVPVLREITNDLIMSTGGTPTVPLLIRQGTAGEIEGTPGNKPGIGRGDGIMIAGDVRALAREYCARGVKVQYGQSELLSHLGATAVWIPETLLWLGNRFAGRTPPQNCSSIAPGNPDALKPAPAP